MSRTFDWENSCTNSNTSHTRGSVLVMWIIKNTLAASYNLCCVVSINVVHFVSRERGYSTAFLKQARGSCVDLDLREPVYEKSF